MERSSFWPEATDDKDKNLIERNEDEKSQGEEDNYDDYWDYLYDDIEWQNQKTKFRKSEKKENRRNNKHDWQ